jgi:ankyrin repeat protein
VAGWNGRNASGSSFGELVSTDVTLVSAWLASFIILCPLIQKGLIVAKPIHGHNSAGWSPLHHAALLSTPPLISFLLTAGANPHAMTAKGLTPLCVYLTTVE